MAPLLARHQLEQPSATAGGVATPTDVKPTTGDLLFLNRVPETRDELLQELYPPVN